MLQRTALRTFRIPLISPRPFSSYVRLRQEQQPLYQPPQQPQPEPEKPNPHREVYRSGTGRAIAYNFLIAMAAFQVIYWSWLKLESIEVKQEKQSEITSLEGQLKSLTGKDKAA